MTRPRKILAAALAALFVGLTAVAQPAVADDLSHKRQQTQNAIDAADRRAAELEDAIEELTGDVAEAIKQLEALRHQVVEATAKLTQAQGVLDEALRKQQLIAAQLADAQSQETVLGQQIADGENQQAAIRAAIGQMAREAYRGGGDVSALTMILDADSAQDFVQSYSMLGAAQRTQEEVFNQLANLEAENKNKAARLEAVRLKITELKAEADRQVQVADEARQAAANAKAEVERLEREQADLKASKEGDLAAARAQLAEVDAAKAELDQQLKAIIEEQRRRAAEQGTTANPGQALPGAWFSNPTATVPMYVTSEYGMRLHPVLGYWRLHAGIDLRDRCGQPVYAGRDGRVQWTRLRPGYGNQVMIDHGWVNGQSLMSSYNHMQSFTTSAGAWVTAGQLIGYAGNTGTSAACHLHFEVYINGGTVNPRGYLGL